MSPICQTFVQNAWRKDLCSNCFKSKEEHGSRPYDCSSRSYSTDCAGTKRYVGVAGRSTLYGRNYYGNNSWNSTNRSLVSPALIKGMDSLIKQENERNLQDMEVKAIPKASVPSDSWIISQIIADTRDFNAKRRMSERRQGDSSSDLGSDASHDTSGSSSSGCSGHYDFRNGDDTGSEPDSAHEEEPAHSSSSSDSEEPEEMAPDRKTSVMSEPSKTEPRPHSILKLTKSLPPLVKTASVTFMDVKKVIGFGGDVDYSDSDGDECDDEDDNASISSSDLTSDERHLKYLTERNTNLNSEDLNEPILEEEPKQDVRVKLKRSQPVKPTLKPSLSLGSEEETIPMRGIKPKFVSREEEMRENVDFGQMYEKSQKVTSIDDSILTSVETSKVTSIDDVIEETSVPKVTSFVDQPPKAAPREHRKMQNKEPEENYDYTVKSAQESSLNNVLHQKNQNKSLNQTEDSKENLEKIRPSVIPLNMINIQRRNSFMESQLGGSIYNNAEEKTNEATSPKEQPIIVKEIKQTESESIKTENLDLTNEKSVPKEEINQNNEKSNQSLSTFGTPPVSPSKNPQSSFLHSGQVRPSTNIGEVASVIYSTPEFLREIASKPCSQPAPTASIQKSAIYASSSVLKGLPGPKPATTPKPKLPPKTRLIPPRAPVSKVSSALSTPNLTSISNSPCKVTSANSSECLLSSKVDDSPVYAVPVTSPTSSTVSAPSPTSSSSGYSSTSNISSSDLHAEVRPDPAASPELKQRKSSNEDSKAAFEATRNLLSAHLSFPNDSKNAPEPIPPTPEVTKPEPAVEKPPASIDSANYERENYPKPMISENLINKISSYDQHSYVNLPPTQESQDFDSFSSFTDDFDDDDDDNESRTGHYTVNAEVEKPVAHRKSERSSSATPIYRNSVGPVTVCALNVGDTIEPSKQPAVRSHSAPRFVDNKIHPSAFFKAKESTSKFSFVKSGFFRPNSPPSTSRKLLSERGRDRSKKSHSVFSLRKLLRLGSGGDKINKDVKTSKETQVERESRKAKLQIIHPLDYNTNGVEVIARPEKRVPAFDPSDLYRNSNFDSLQGDLSSVDHMHRNATSLVSFPEPKHNPKPVKKNSFLRKKKKSERKDSERSDVRPAVTYVRRPSTCSSVSDSVSRSNINACSGASHLGFNSEGRPKPPPPPRKTSLEATSHEVFFVTSLPEPPNSSSNDHVMMAPPNPRVEADASSLSSNASSTRPSRPPPPRRTPSVSGGPKTSKPRDHTLYANLGNARASFTPRKPGRSSSVREEEKRKAPNPPSGLPEGGRLNKGPAPLLPLDPRNHDYEIIAGSTPDKNIESSSRAPILTNLSLRDQYGAVTNSNLETLSNMLEQLCNKPFSSRYDHVRVSRWSDLTLTSRDPICCGFRLFYPCRIGPNEVTVMVTPENKTEEDSLLAPTPICSFKDELPSAVLNVRTTSDQMLKTTGSVWVLPRMALSSLEDFGHRSQRLLHENPAEWQRKTCLFLLQMVSALKQLQAKGIEEASLDFVLVGDDFEGDSSPRLIMAPPSPSTGSQVSLCHCAAAAAQLLLGNSRPLTAAMQGPVLSPPSVPAPHAFSTLVTALREERASSLTRAKCILEAMLFGPDNLRASSEPNLDSSLQQWLDLQRANVLHSLVRDPSSILTKFHLLFLVRSNIRSMAEALRALQAPDVTNF